MEALINGKTAFGRFTDFNQRFLMSPDFERELMSMLSASKHWI
jgi:hypothetical protein